MNSNSGAVKKETAKAKECEPIHCIQLGIFEIDTWYPCSYPGEFPKQSKIYTCEHCLKYMYTEMVFRCHLGNCIARQPPGKEIYVKESFTIWEVNGKDEKLYAQNLCLLAKNFLPHKYAIFNVESFLFYVLRVTDNHDLHTAGYFSKKQDSSKDYNVVSILIFPPFQNKGYGKLLIGMSYELAKLEGAVCTPERPLSDLGTLAYQSYWTWVILEKLQHFKGLFAIAEFSQMTGIAEGDIRTVLLSLKLMKYWKGQHIVCMTPHMINSLINSSVFKKPTLVVDTIVLQKVLLNKN